MVFDQLEHIVPAHLPFVSIARHQMFQPHEISGGSDQAISGKGIHC